MYKMLKKPRISDTVQCVRKRVYGSGDHIEESDLFYDKSDGKYYKNMREIGYCADCQIYPDEYRHYLRLSQEDHSAHTILLAELPDRITYIKLPKPLEEKRKGGPAYAQPLRGNHYKGTLVHKGVEELSPPPVVRLYSEAEMAHAAKLASTMTNAEMYRRFGGIGGMRAPGGVFPAGKVPLIKATEYDDREHVLARYASSVKSSGNDTKAAFMAGRLMAVRHSLQSVPLDGDKMEKDKQAAIDKESVGVDESTRGKIARNFRKGYDAVMQGLPDLQATLAAREGFDSMEVSYGGHTGDMTFRRIPQPRYVRYRQYSIIQSTFFWLPGADSMENAKCLLRFFMAKAHKLQPGGIIRIVSFSGDGSHDAEWWKKPNRYQEAAEWVCKQLKKTGYTDVEMKMLESHGRPQSYSDALTEAGLNPEQPGNPPYRPLWTDVRKNVGGGGEKRDNLIIQARKPQRFLPV